MSGFTEIHSHFVYGMDDGAQSREDMFAMLDSAYENGVTCLYATPHVVPGMKEFHQDTYRDHLEEARAYCDRCHYDMTLRSGAEILYTPQLAWYAENHHLPVLEGTKSVLLEFSPQIPYRDLTLALEMLAGNGYSVILAHAERYVCLRKPGALKKLRTQYGVCIQMNANTVVHHLSVPGGLLLRRWLSHQMVDYIASDAHNTSSRPFRTRQAYSRLAEMYGTKYADSLTKAKP